MPFLAVAHKYLFFLKNSFLYPFVKSRKYFLLQKEACVLISTIKITDYQLFSCVGRPLACSAIVGSISTLLFVPFETLISKYFIIEIIARKRISEGKIMLRVCCVRILFYFFNMYKILPATENVFWGTNYVNFQDIMIYLNA